MDCPVKACLTNTRLVCGGIAAVSALALAAAFTAQYGFGLQPCTLCLFQRVPFALNIAIGLGGFYLASKHHARLATLAIAVAGLVFLANAVIAFYHAGVEQHWWVSFLEGCKVDFSNANLTPAQLLEKIKAKPAVRCDEIPWSLFGISMAGYNAMMSLGLAALSFAAAFCGSKPK